MAVQRISVGVDGSSQSAAALRWADGLARAINAELTALSTWQMPLVASMPAAIGALPSQAFMASHCAENLDKALAETGELGPLGKEVRQGDPGAVLAEESAKTDLVVIGRTGQGRRHGVARIAEVLLGSAARYCIHHAQGPVAAVPADARWVDRPKVVVGVDGSDSSIAALRWAVQNLPASSIHAVQAVAPYYDGLLAFDHTALDRILDETDRQLVAAIRTATADLPLDAVAKVQPLVLVEDARDAVIDPGFAPDLIVVGERGRRGIAGRVLGSVSDHSVRHARCPVIVVPTNQEAN